MKTITLKTNNCSIIILEDTDVVTIESNHVKCNEERIYGIGTDSVDLHEGITVPEDWATGKYFFDGIEWTLNTDWIDSRELLKSKIT